jgi:RNA polymerase sigma factor (sigma-70 family)
MVIATTTTESGEKALRTDQFWYVSDRRIRTDAAAERAIEITDWVGSLEREGEAPGEQELFIALHTCAFWASGRSRRNRLSHYEQTEWAERWQALRTYMVEENQGLAYSMIKRFASKDLDLDELRSEALYALMRAVDRFNPWRECRFSTYACNAIRRALFTHSKKVIKLRRQFPAQQDVGVEDTTTEDHGADLYAERLQRVLEHNLGELTDLESKILARRFPMNATKRLTLQEIGDSIGLSNERVRQLQNRALKKLREVLLADPVLQ